MTCRLVVKVNLKFIHIPLERRAAGVALSVSDIPSEPTLSELQCARSGSHPVGVVTERSVVENREAVDRVSTLVCSWSDQRELATVLINAASKARHCLGRCVASGRSEQSERRAGVFVFHTLAPVFLMFKNSLV